MVLKLASNEVQEVRRALSAAHLQVLRELSQGGGCRNGELGLELCQRKWRLEALLQQLDHSGDPPPVPGVIPAGTRGVIDREAV